MGSHYAKCRNLFIVMVNVIMLSVVKLNVIRLNVVAQLSFLKAEIHHLW